MHPARVTITAAAAEHAAHLLLRHGARAFVLDGDGVLRCVTDAGASVAGRTVLIGHVAGLPFHIATQRYAACARARLRVDLAAGSEGFVVHAAPLSVGELVALRRIGVPVQES